MKTFIVVTALLPLIAYAQVHTNKDLLEKEQVEVLNTVKAWNNAFSANNPDVYFQFIHDDITLFLPGNPYRVDGKQDDREEFEYSLKKGWTRVGYFQELQPKVQLNGNTAVVTYHNRGTYGDGDREKTIFLKETDVLVKEDGKWRIIHIHVSGVN